MTNAVTLTRVCKSFDTVRAVEELSLQIPQGEIFGLLGPNGAGKTTTIRMLLGILMPDSGTIEILGKSSCREIADQVGFLPEERGLFKRMVIIDIIKFFAELKGIPPRRAVPLADMWLERFELKGWRDKKVEELSKGMQQKVQFITTILHEPKLVFLDEPFSGLDPVNTNLIKDVMLELVKNGTTIVFSTHMMEQAEKLCDALCLMNNGRNVLQGSLAEVKGRFGRNRCRISYEGDARFLKDSALVSRYDDYGQYVEIQPADGVTAQALLAQAISQVTVRSFDITEPSLNEIFINVVTGGAGTGGNHE
ncbi:MAG TPA: ATP-binding cassette domain-containing protein [bacterium]|nr:ATP-binding cassette domain-containing protein [bacterium]